MGVWSNYAAKQLVVKNFRFVPGAAGLPGGTFVKSDRLNTQQAMRLVAYWQSRLPIKNQQWRPVLAAIVREAPERKRWAASKLLATDRLLRLIFGGETHKRPPIEPEVQAAVFSYVTKAAVLMDILKPGAVPPVVPKNILDAQAKRLVDQLETKPTPIGRKGIGLGLLLLLAVIASEAR